METNSLNKKIVKNKKKKNKSIKVCNRYNYGNIVQKNLKELTVLTIFVGNKLMAYIHLIDWQPVNN